MRMKHLIQQEAEAEPHTLRDRPILEPCKPDQSTRDKPSEIDERFNAVANQLANLESLIKNSLESRQPKQPRQVTTNRTQSNPETVPVSAVKEIAACFATQMNKQDNNQRNYRDDRRGSNRIYNDDRRGPNRNYGNNQGNRNRRLGLSELLYLGTG